jgi:hypothetical protein
VIEHTLPPLAVTGAAAVAVTTAPAAFLRRRIAIRATPNPASSEAVSHGHESHCLKPPKNALYRDFRYIAIDRKSNWT